MIEALSRAESLLRQTCGDRLRVDLPMAPLTTFRIGGPAALYLEPQDEPDLAAVARAVSEVGLPVVVVGKGSNVLVSDVGFPGLVLRLGSGYRWAARAGDEISAGGAMPLPALAGVALRHGLTGLEFGVAIPATLGGAVRMNAGAHDGSMADVVRRIDVFSLVLGVTEKIFRDDAGFTYRGSALPDDAVVTGATLALSEGETRGIRERMDEARVWRRRTQPLAEPNCGSVFTNPPDDHAARLIEEAGGKGLRVGGAAVSHKHANFIIAEQGATAADVAALIERIRTLVLGHSGIRLETEVRLIGEFERAPV